MLWKSKKIIRDTFHVPWWVYQIIQIISIQYLRRVFTQLFYIVMLWRLKENHHSYSRLVETFSRNTGTPTNISRTHSVSSQRLKKEQFVNAEAQGKSLKYLLGVFLLLELHPESNINNPSIFSLPLSLKFLPSTHRDYIFQHIFTFQMISVKWLNALYPSVRLIHPVVIRRRGNWGSSKNGIVINIDFYNLWDLRRILPRPPISPQKMKKHYLHFFLSPFLNCSKKRNAIFHQFWI